MNIRERATRNHIRFNTTKGLLSTEDIWTLDIKVADEMYKALSVQLKDTSTESLLAPSKTDKDIELAHDVLKYIIQARLKEHEEAKNVKLLKIRQQQLMQIQDDRKSEALVNSSDDDLAKELKEISASLAG